MKGMVVSMSTINEIELKNLKQILEYSQTNMEQFRAYASETDDPYIRQFFESRAKSCEKNKNTILQLLR